MSSTHLDIPRNWVDGKQEWNLAWRRCFFAWEIELHGKLLNEINRTSLQPLAHHVQQQSLPSQHLLFLWRSKAPLKVTTFAWRLFQDKIPSKEALSRRGLSFPMGDDLSCLFCNNHPESSAHIFSSRFST
ncbi:hypothetical protein Lal_00029502 [Lupinus albus]|nr:hypothetical protein Lal_00029502 [Lupinus albus]